MLPFVAVHGYQFNDTSFGVAVGALAAALFYRLLRALRERGESDRSMSDNVLLALTLCFGSVFFYCALRGEVWFSAEVMGVGLTCLYLLNAVGAKRPLLAGVFFSTAVLTRTPLIFTGVFFVLEALAPTQGKRLEELSRFRENKEGLRKLGAFALGALPLALVAALYNKARFGHFGEFGHSFLFNNRVNADIDTYGLFHPTYVLRNLKAALYTLPSVEKNPLRLGYDPHGLSLLFTLPFLVLLGEPRARTKRPLTWLMVGLGMVIAVGLTNTDGRSFDRWRALAELLPLVSIAVLLKPRMDRRLAVPLWVAVAFCALPGLFYQNDGYMQFGFRFSLDYTPYLVLLLAVSGWSLKDRLVVALLSLGFAVNFWGAAAFRGYTELVRRW
jgi:hypothetical protein